MKLATRDLIVLFSITVLFALTYSAIYPLHAPSSGYFMIENVPKYFWVLYIALLLSHCSSLLVVGSSRISKPLLIALTYTLLYSCSLRAFATLHFSGFMGSDSPNFVGLTQYWVSHDRLDLARVSYGDNPGLFILGKVTVLIADLDVNLYTTIMGITWIAVVYLMFRLMTSLYVATSGVGYPADYGRGEPTNTMVPLVAALTYFALAVPFSVNIQYSPQTFALVLLLLYFFLLGRFLIMPESSQAFVPILIAYAAIQVSHPFMFMFGISTAALLVSARWLRWFTKPRSTPATSPYARRRGLAALLLAMTALSSAHILYQTVLLRRRVGEVIRSILEALELRFPVEYFEQLSTPAFPHYELSYYLVAVAHSVTWIVIAVIIAALALRTLSTRVPKYYEFSIMAGSLVALVAFMSTLMLQEFVARAGQVLLFGALLLAIKGMAIENSRLRVAGSRLLVLLLFGLLVASSFLAFIRYTWYAQPPHLSPSDIIIANTLENVPSIDHAATILSKNALGVYYCSKNYGTPFALCKTPILLVTGQHVSLEELEEKYDLILWDRSLSLEFFKYIGREMPLSVLLSQGSVLINANGTILIENPFKR